MNNTPEIVQWAQDYLLSHGYTLNGHPQDVQITPWSCVIRFLTSKGAIYLKQTPEGLSLEPIITKILHDRFHASVPVILSSNQKLNCFLMEDAGEPLREIFKQKLQPDLLGAAIEQYSMIQKRTSQDVDTFLKLGMPDWRLKILPAIYKEYIRQEDLLIGDGLTSNELKKLNDLHDEFSTISEKLSEYKIPETLDHCDFHDNNILIQPKTKRITIIDLGETVITHPFFSLINCLRNFRFRYSFKETDRAYLNLKELCLTCDIYKNETKENIAKAFLLANQLWPIYESLGQYRLMSACDATQFKLLNRHGRLTRGLKGFIEIGSGGL